MISRLGVTARMRDLLPSAKFWRHAEISFLNTKYESGSVNYTSRLSAFEDSYSEHLSGPIKGIARIHCPLTVTIGKIIDRVTLTFDDSNRIRFMHENVIQVQ